MYLGSFEELKDYFDINLTLLHMPGYNKRKEHYLDYQVNIGNVADIVSSKKPPKTREELIIEELELKRKMLSSIEEDIEQDRMSAIGKDNANSSNLISEKISDNKASKTDQNEEKKFNKIVSAIGLFIIFVTVVFFGGIIGQFIATKTVTLFNRFHNSTAPIENTQINQPETMYFQDFKAKVQGKTEDQIRERFGNPDQAQEFEGVKMWYYQNGSNKIRIINEDTKNEVFFVQIEFLLGSAYSINAW